MESELAGKGSVLSWCLCDTCTSTCGQCIEHILPVCQVIPIGVVLPACMGVYQRQLIR